MAWRFEQRTFYIDQFIGDQTRFGTSWHAKMTLNDLTWKLMSSNLHTNSKHVLKTYQTWKVLYAKQPTPNQNSSLVNRSNEPMRRLQDTQIWLKFEFIKFQHHAIQIWWRKVKIPFIGPSKVDSVDPWHFVSCNQQTADIVSNEISV